MNSSGYINIPKVLDNYMSRCKSAGGDSRGGIGLVGGHQFFSEKHSSLYFSNNIKPLDVNDVKINLYNLFGRRRCPAVRRKTACKCFTASILGLI